MSKTTSYGYDDAGNLTSIDYPVMTDVSLSYDAVNRLTNMVDAVGTTMFTHSETGRLLTEDSPWASDTVTLGYHADVPGLRTTLSLLQPTGSWSQTSTYISRL